MSVLAIDAGTTGVTALVVAEDATVMARGYQEFPQHFPRPGWVEHDPEEIWTATLQACRAALDAAEAIDKGVTGVTGERTRSTTGTDPVTAVGITNQRETVVLWDRQTLRAPTPAIVWQDRRSSDICTELADAGHGDRIAELTGLRLDPYFSATKLRWLAANSPVWSGVTGGDLAIGTVDSYLIARLTGGGRHVTDASNASRTLLYDTFAGAWSEELCNLFGVPITALPEVVPSAGVLARTDPASFAGLDLPVAGIAGDQQAALFGQACFEIGQGKCTYGTGSFVLVNTGSTPVRSEAGLLTTVAWDLGEHGDGPTYALEGSVFVTGAAVQWLRDGLGIIGSAAEIESLARLATDTGGVVFVPALTGLGAPHWDPEARGLIVGLTRGTSRAQLALATLEAIAFEVRDVVDAMTGSLDRASQDTSGRNPDLLGELSVDGGASANELLCQLQADQLGTAVRRPQITETTGLGAAFLAGLGAGVWSSTAEVADAWRLDRRFVPVAGARDDGRHRRWTEAVRRAKGWAAFDRDGHDAPTGDR
jgi:glycerol kinase